MQESELRAWIALHRTPGLSARSLRKLLRVAQEPAQIWQLSPQQLQATGISPPAYQAITRGPDRALQQQVDKDLRCIEQQSISLLPLTSPDYPQLLKETADPPPLLYVKGDIATLSQPQIAVVGSCRCSRQGGENAFSFARELAQGELTITSGCALGIDTHSHRGALAVAGTTIGVLGTGVDIIYPRRNQRLFADVIKHGALVSEFPLATQPQRSLFPQRNRLISGLSLGVIVVEAALQSGSLITARFALEQGREVFAIPGSIHNPETEGCHYLIRQGAQLVTSAAEVLEQLQNWAPGRQAGLFSSHKADASTHLQHDLAPREQTLLELIGFDPATLETLLTRTNWDIAELQSLLTGLEIKGVIEQAAGRYQRLLSAGATL